MSPGLAQSVQVRLENVAQDTGRRVRRYQHPEERPGRLQYRRPSGGWIEILTVDDM